MPPVKFSRVISVTSEDPRYPAKNLLNSDVVSPWKCKEPGEKQAAIILQLDESCVIQSIDIGNENSAFIEIFVGKSITPDSFEILRVASVLMSVQDCKTGNNKNTVRFFKHDEFAKPVSNQSWDQLKIVCTQPFNKHAQYGISFIKVHSKSDTAPVSNSVFGKFAMKKDENDDVSISTGSFFAKRKLLTQDVSAASAIRQAANDPSGSILNKVTTGTKRLSDLLPNKNTKKPRTNGDINDDSLSNDCRRSTKGRLLYSQDDADDDQDDDSSSKPTTPSSSQNKNQTPKRDTPTTKKKDTPVTPKITPKRDTVSPATPKNKPKINDTPKQKNTKDEPSKKRVNNDPPTGSQKPPKIDIAPKKRKPFNKLLEGVVFAISGYQNPFRGELRSKAMKMGAKYRADWDDTCTHLICAFTNTPKYVQVLGLGWIVRKDWIEDCFKSRKRLLSSGYKLDKNDPYANSNDEEIWELDKTSTNDPPSQPPPKEKKVTSQPVSTASSNDLIGSQDLTQFDPGSPIFDQPQTDIYDVETDVDSEHEDPQLDLKYETVSMKVLPEFFKNKKFYLGTDLLQSASKTLRRYITAYKGEPQEDVDEADYIISEETRYKDNVSGTPVVLPDWIWECSDQKKLVPVDNYLV
ncbi:DNA repair protein XRCC1-like [Planococcus citri]|uniref:DNA repair protein XRCC1-like n=1 Tax=Planococcus citri TaxID=170843 RepID=UPI0031F7B599